MICQGLRSPQLPRPLSLGVRQVGLLCSSQQQACREIVELSMTGRHAISMVASFCDGHVSQLLLFPKSGRGLD
jgi:prepilin-type processing-associated H-X9-DG protein